MKMYFIRRFSIFSLIVSIYFLHIQSSFAQSDSVHSFLDTTILEPVTVTAFGGAINWKDAPATVSLIQKTALQRLDNTAIVPVLNTVPGVRMEERSPGSYRLSIRGSLLRSPFGIRNIKVYWNDMPLTDAGGNTYLNLVDISQLTSIEIAKGPASSMYGANTGGVVLLHSDPSVFQKKFSANIETGSYDLFNEQLTFNHQTKKLSFSLQQSHYQNKGYRQQSVSRKGAVQGVMNWNINNKEQLSALLFYTDLHYETPGGITKQQMDSLPTLARQPSGTTPGAVQQQAGVYNKTGFAGLTLHSDFGKGWTNTTSATISYTDFKNPFITNYEHRKEMNYGARTAFEWNILKAKWITGFEWQQNISHINNFENNNGKPGTQLYDDEVHVMQYFAFTQLNMQFKCFTIQAGISANQQILKFNRISDPVYNYWQHQNTKILLAPRLSALYKMNKNISIFAILSKGFSPPTLAEIRPSTNQFYNLQPEYGWNFECGIKGTFLHNRIDFQASVYSFHLSNAIVQQQDSSGTEYFVNAGSTRQNGVELWLQAHLLKNNNRLFRALTISNSFSFQPYTFGDYISGAKNLSGNRLTGTPRCVNVVQFDINTQLGIYLNTNYNFTSSIPLSDDNDVYADSYNLLQCKLGYILQLRKIGMDFYIGADNLLNETYSLGNDLNAFGGRYFNPAPKRNYFFGVKFEL